MSKGHLIIVAEPPIDTYSTMILVVCCDTSRLAVKWQLAQCSFTAPRSCLSLIKGDEELSFLWFLLVDYSCPLILPCLESLKASFSPYFPASTCFVLVLTRRALFAQYSTRLSVHLMRLALHYTGVFHNTTFVFRFSLAIRVIWKMQLIEKNVHSLVCYQQ